LDCIVAPGLGKAPRRERGFICELRGHRLTAGQPGFWPTRSAPPAEQRWSCNSSTSANSDDWERFSNSSALRKSISPATCPPKISSCMGRPAQSVKAGSPYSSTLSSMRPIMAQIATFAASSPRSKLTPPGSAPDANRWFEIGLTSRSMKGQSTDSKTFRAGNEAIPYDSWRV